MRKRSDSRHRYSSATRACADCNCYLLHRLKGARGRSCRSDCRSGAHRFGGFKIAHADGSQSSLPQAEPSQDVFRIHCLNFADARLEKTHFTRLMRTSIFRIAAVPTEIAERARRAVKTGTSDHALMTADSPTTYPCRHCLRWAQPGERVILFP